MLHLGGIEVNDAGIVFHGGVEVALTKYFDICIGPYCGFLRASVGDGVVAHIYVDLGVDDPALVMDATSLGFCFMIMKFIK